MARSPEAESSIQETATTPKLESHLTFDVPGDLSPNHPVENEFGTWRMLKAKNGDTLTVFDAGLHLSHEPKGTPVPHVTDINAFTSGILEEELGKLDRNRQIEEEVHERLGRIPRLHVRNGLRRAAAFATRR